MYALDTVEKINADVRVVDASGVLSSVGLLQVRTGAGFGRLLSVLSCVDFCTESEREREHEVKMLGLVEVMERDRREDEAVRHLILERRRRYTSRSNNFEIT